jgi:hypothetical protein
MISKLKEFTLQFIPFKVQRRYFNYQRHKATRNMNVQDRFTEIYKKSEWGKSESSDQLFYSGPGSHNLEVVSSYVTAVVGYLNSFDIKLNAVDLGCGDFAVGSKIRKYFNNYIACDIVEPLIEFNKEKYKDLCVDFFVLDIIKGELPSGDIVLLRQVLQHLSNEQIAQITLKLKSKYKYAIITEHIPLNQNFKPNKDKPQGHDVRLDLGSGVILTKPPFNFKVLSHKILCEVKEGYGIIQTIAYQIS